MEEVRDEVHDHAAVCLKRRGMSAAQKDIVIQCECRRQSQPKWVIDEFTRLATAAIAANEIVIPTPTTDMISSFLSNRKKAARNGVAVGKTTLHDLDRYANTNRFSTLKISIYYKTIAVTNAILRTFLLHIFSAVQ